MAPRLQQGHRLWPRFQASMWIIVVSWGIDFSTDPSCSWTTDPDMTPGINSTWSVSWPQVEAPGTQIGIALAAVWPPDTFKATSCIPDPRFHVALGDNMGHELQHRPWLR